jgi:hypothetical protein
MIQQQIIWKILLAMHLRIQVLNGMRFQKIQYQILDMIQAWTHLHRSVQWEIHAPGLPNARVFLHLHP